MFKRIAYILVCAGMLGLTACGSAVNADGRDDGRLNVVCTTFPSYDWTREIMGSHTEEAELTCLLDNGTDLHNYQPSAADIVKISGCDVFIYVGGESENWVEDALKEASNKDMKVIRLLDKDRLDVKEEEVKEGMEAETEEEEEESGAEYDEHVWLSVRNAGTLCGDIADALSEADPDNAADYSKNLGDYREKLEQLDKEFTDVIGNAEKKAVVFGDRFPFRYLFDDYGLDYYAAFLGCSAETEASFDTVTFLAEKVDELGTDTVFTIENSDGKIADAVINSTKKKDQHTAVLNSLQSVDAEESENGTTYISLMEQNCQTLKNALD